jgi:hypothetical protein
MQNKNLTRWLWLFILAALLVGCGAPAIPPTQTPFPTQPPPTSTPIPPTETPAPTDTPTPTFTPVPTQSLTTIIEAVQSAVQGVGMGEAAAYDHNKPGIHPIVIIATSDDLNDWNENLPESWMPLNVGQTELVASISYREIEINKTRYKGQGSGWIYVMRVRLDTVVTLYEAQTGDVVDTHTFQGADPITFPPSLPYGTQYLYGDTVAYETVIDWLTSYVEP